MFFYTHTNEFFAWWSTLSTLGSRINNKCVELNVCCSFYVDAPFVYWWRWLPVHEMQITARIYTNDLISWKYYHTRKTGCIIKNVFDTRENSLLSRLKTNILIATKSTVFLVPSFVLRPNKNGINYWNGIIKESMKWFHRNFYCNTCVQMHSMRNYHLVK